MQDWGTMQSNMDSRQCLFTPMLEILSPCYLEDGIHLSAQSLERYSPSKELITPLWIILSRIIHPYFILYCRANSILTSQSPSTLTLLDILLTKSIQIYMSWDTWTTLWMKRNWIWSTSSDMMTSTSTLSATILLSNLPTMTCSNLSGKHWTKLVMLQ